MRLVPFLASLAACVTEDPCSPAAVPWCADDLTPPELCCAEECESRGGLLWCADACRVEVTVADATGFTWQVPCPDDDPSCDDWLASHSGCDG